MNEKSSFANIGSDQPKRTLDLPPVGSTVGFPVGPSVGIRVGFLVRTAQMAEWEGTKEAMVHHVSNIPRLY